MPEVGNPSALRWLIGVELRTYRKRSGLSLATAAKAVKVSAGMVGHYESGLYSASPAQIDGLLTAYGAPKWDVDRLAALTGRADDRMWLAQWSDVIPDWLRTYTGLESLAAHEVVYRPLVLHTMVQLPEYSLGATVGSGRVRPDQAERLVAMRMERQRLLTREHPLRFTMLIEEAVLDRPIGGPTVLEAQLEHLVELSHRDTIEIRVLPTALGHHDSLEGSFTMLHFEQAQSIAYIEYPDGAIYVQDPDKVAVYARTGESLRTAALSAEDTRALIAARLDDPTHRKRTEP